MKLVVVLALLLPRAALACESRWVRLAVHRWGLAWWLTTRRPSPCTRACRQTATPRRRTAPASAGALARAQTSHPAGMVSPRPPSPAGLGCAFSRDPLSTFTPAPQAVTACFRKPLRRRSWYAYYTKMDQAMIVDVIDALAVKNRTVKGWEGKVSLCDLGYCAVSFETTLRHRMLRSPRRPARARTKPAPHPQAGIDEGWEGCGLGVNRTQHYLNGTPATNGALFPDMKGLVDYGHSKVRIAQPRARTLTDL